MTRLIPILAAVFLASDFTKAAAAEKPKQPNILLIFADDQS